MKRSHGMILFMCLIAAILMASPVLGQTASMEELTFDSPEEMMEWLNTLAIEDPEAAAELQKYLLNSEKTVMRDACKQTTLTPSSISVTSAFKFKLYQIFIDVQLADCGLTLCSTMGFDLTWNPGPNGGAILIGPIPAEPPGQVCVGNSISSRGFLILTKDVPDGNYNLQVKVGGFGYALYLDLPVTIDIR